MDQEADLYVKYYEAQAGGSLPVFRGAKRYNTQAGAGIGDIFRHIFRTVVPVALSGISSFLGETLRAKNTGASWKDAAKSAVTPTTKNLMEGVTGAIQTHLGTAAAAAANTTQAGTGRTRRKRKIMTDSSNSLNSSSSKKKRRKTLSRIGDIDLQDEVDSFARNRRASFWRPTGSARSFATMTGSGRRRRRQTPRISKRIAAKLAYKRRNSKFGKYKDSISGIKFNF